jgi:hypothetical protein
VNTNNRLRWICSAGGPLVLLQRSSLRHWQGVRGDDYEAAGAVSGYMGKLSRSGYDVLVLWGEPLQTALYQSKHETLLVRWSYAPDEQSVLDALTSLDESTITPLEQERVLIQDDEQFIIDAGAAGDEAEESLRLTLAPCDYLVKTLVYRPSDDIELILHTLTTC